MSQDRNILPNEQDGVESLFNDKAVANDNEHFRLAHRRLFPLALLLASAFLVFLYVISPLSRVSAVSVSGNDYLSMDYIRSLAGIKEDDFYYTVVPASVESKVLADPMIRSCTVKLLSGNIIQIGIEEKQPVGYRYDGDEPELLLSDDETIALTSAYMPIISRVPLISGFDDEEKTHRLIKAFENVTRNAIEDMAGITQYPLSYDDEALEVQMRDGGWFFSSYYSLDKINEYSQYASAQTNKDYCFYAIEDTAVVTSRTCPWNIVSVPKEYWMSESGDYIYNKWGDKAIKHYYRDETGYYLDANGNYILIPIDSNGDDDPDPDFLTHYNAGWYATGVLQDPSQVQEEETDEENQDDASGETTEENNAQSDDSQG